MTENTNISSNDRKSSDRYGNYQSITSSERNPSIKTSAYAINIAVESFSSTVSTSSDPHHSTGHQFHGKKLGLVSLVVLSFYTVCGGPFGIEDIVRAGGPFYALLGFVLIFVWAIPEAMITAELSVALPESAGSVAWVESAFGPFWAFQKGWLSWLSGIADNALYPILFLVSNCSSFMAYSLRRIFLMA
jgi:amino acid permease